MNLLPGCAVQRGWCSPPHHHHPCPPPPHHHPCPPPAHESQSGLTRNSHTFTMNLLPGCAVQRGWCSPPHHHQPHPHHHHLHPCPPAPHDSQSGWTRNIHKHSLWTHYQAVVTAESTFSHAELTTRLCSSTWVMLTPSSSSSSLSSSCSWISVWTDYKHSQTFTMNLLPGYHHGRVNILTRWTYYQAVQFNVGNAHPLIIIFILVLLLLLMNLSLDWLETVTNIHYELTTRLSSQQS